MIKNPEVEKERTIASKWHKTHRAKEKYDAEPGPQGSDGESDAEAAERAVDRALVRMPAD
jgi:hypothetical protein